MSLIRSELRLHDLVQKLARERRSHLIAVEIDDAGIQLETFASAQDMAEAALAVLRFAVECDSELPPTDCPVCSERRRRVAECLAILGAPLSQGHFH